jgi:hypothetical protein
MYTCLSHGLGNLQNNWTVYIYALYKLCIILSFLCFTAHKVLLRSMAMQQTGTVLNGKKFTHKSVSSLQIFTRNVMMSRGKCNDKRSYLFVYKR